MKNHIYFSAIAAAILVMLSLLSGKASSTGLGIESHTLVNQNPREESHHEHKEND